MTAIGAHGIRVAAPAGWDLRIFRHGAGEPTLHAASFALPERVGEFGTAATRAMPADGLFLTLTEYRPDARLRPGVGLFAGSQPRHLPAASFRREAVLAQRPGQLALQRFFTVGERPFCLYTVAGSRAALRKREDELQALLGSLVIEAHPAG